MQVTAVIPAYNEESTIQKVVKAASKNVQQVIVIDDASKDATYKKVKQLNLHNVKLIRHRKNTGKCGALKTAMKHVKTPYTLFLDADLIGINENHLKLLVSKAETASMVVALRDKMGRIGHFTMKNLPIITGERLVRTDIVHKVLSDPLCYHYNMEILLHFGVKNTEVLILPGVKDTFKPLKWGISGTWKFMAEFLIMGYVLTRITFRKTHNYE